MTTDLQSRIRAAVAATYQRLEPAYGTFPIPTVNFGLKGVVAGQAIVNTNTLRFNLILAELNQTDFLAQTVPHEVAHLIAWAVYRDGGHGPGWKSIMSALSLPAKRCHSYDTSHARPNLYHCACSEHVLSNRLHAAIQRGQSRHCLRCKGTISVGPRISIDPSTLPPIDSLDLDI